MFRSVYAVFGYLMLLAAVSANAYTINYNLNGGVNHPENPESYDEAAGRFDLKEPSREGYSFLGWYIEFAEGVDVPPNMYYGEYQDYSMFVLANYLGSFSVYARWGLVPQTPKQDERGCYLIYTAEEASVLHDLAERFFDGAADDGSTGLLVIVIELEGVDGLFGTDEGT